MLTTLVRALMTLASFSSLRRRSPEWAAAWSASGGRQEQYLMLESRPWVSRTHAEEFDVHPGFGPLDLDVPPIPFVSPDLVTGQLALQLVRSGDIRRVRIAGSHRDPRIGSDCGATKMS